MTADTMKEMFIRTLKRENEFFERYDDSRDDMVSLYVEGDNMEQIEIMISFSRLNNGSLMVHVACYDLPNFSSRLEAGYRLCNALNDDELVKYYIDDDGDLVTTNCLFYNAYGVSCDYSPEETLILATVTATSVDEVYPKAQKARWA